MEVTPREQRRAERLAADPEAAERRRAHDSRPRPGRKDTRGSRPRRQRGKPYVIAPIDGEGFEWPEGQRYGLLHILGRPPLVNPEGITTQQALDYILDAPATWALVGFGLTYDAEHWLRDLPDDAYLALTNGGATVTWRGYELRWIPGKMLSVKRGRAYRLVQDSWGYYQCSLLRALERAKLSPPAEVTAGKAERGGFLWEGLAGVQKYAREEGIVFRHLTQHLRANLDGGLTAAGMPSSTRGDLYGPGSLARKFLRLSAWREEHPLAPPGIMPEAHHYLRPECREWAKLGDQLERFPFSAAYAAGRIECAAIGRWERVTDWDLHSAYPAALARLPAWRASDYQWQEGPEAERAANLRRVGMYLVAWDLPPEWDWYPFPYRDRTGNLTWPQWGTGWVMSPEVFAAEDTLPERGWRVLAALTLRGTEGLGAGDAPLPKGAGGRFAPAVEAMYSARQRLIREGNGGHVGLKLVLNSLSGQLQRQVGRSPEEPGDYSDLGAAWYTSWTRAQVWRTIAPWRAGQRVIAVQTDGVVTLPGLTPAGRTGDGLGEWEGEDLEGYRQFGAGLYDAAGLPAPKKRGFPSFDPDQAYRVLTGELDRLPLRYRFFVGRRHALAQPDLRVWTPGATGEPDTTLAESRYQWREAVRDYAPSLGSKREEPWAPRGRGRTDRDWALRAGAAARRGMPLPIWTQPKQNMAGGPLGRWSQPYQLRWRQAEAWVADATEPEGPGDALSPAEEARLGMGEE